MSNTKEINARYGQSVITEIEVPVTEDCGNGRIPEDAFYSLSHENTGHVPSADAAGSRKARTGFILVPEFQSMTKLLFKKYRLRMYSYLRGCLSNGMLDRLVGQPVKNRTFNADSCSFPGVSYWKIDREHFLADIRVDLKIETDRPPACCLPEEYPVRESAMGDGVTFLWKGTLSLLFGFEKQETCSIFDFCRGIPERDFVLLSRYLIPYYKNPMVDSAAMDIWKKYLPSALDDPDKRDPSVLAERMGLGILYLPVTGMEGTPGILFLESGTLKVMEDRDTKEVPIPPDTIVINTNAVRQEYCGFDIFHECFHYEEHYLFYRLQKLQNSRPASAGKRPPFKMRQVSVDDPDRDDPLFWCEKQATRGAYGLMMPALHMETRIRDELEKAGSCRHIGQRFEKAGIRIARQTGLPYFRIRARMIQLGHIAAKGALNYVDRRRIEAFAFSHNAWHEEKHTFIIDRAASDRLYESNKALKDLMDSGEYIYADGHIVKKEFTVKTPHGLRLTDWANSHVDRCCLRFTRLYIQKNVGDYVFGRMNYDADYIRQTGFYLEDFMEEQGVKNEEDVIYRYMDDFADRNAESFKDLFDTIRKKNGMSLESYAELIHADPGSLR